MTTTQTPRAVTVRKVRDSWIVIYMDRKKGQRYSPGGFHESIKTEEEVKQWVRDNPKLQLIEQ